MYLDVRDALVEAVQSGRMPGERLEDAAARVADLRAWTAQASRTAGSPGAAGAAGTARAAGPDRDGGADIGLAAARRAVRVDGALRPLHRPLVVEVVPPDNMAAGSVPWGLSPWVPADSVRRISTADAQVGSIAGLLADATGRSLVVVVRDAHRYPAATDVVSQILADRPDAVVVEMGLPVWRPPAGGLYLATFGAARTSSRAAAEVLGLAAP